ncbi:MAG: methylenetetrahydrofolate reductase, partial [Aquiluna sp.]
AKELVGEFLGEGISDFLALRGDLPEGQTHMPPGTLSRADQLVKLIGEARADKQGITAVAAFPNGHPESGNDRSDIAALLAKQEAGASFAITQLFFFAEDYLNFVSLARSRGVTMDLIPGIMPIVSPTRLSRVLELTGERKPEGLAQRLGQAEDAASRREVGINWAASLVRELADADIDAVHLYAFNEYANVTEVLRRAGVV